MTNHRDPRYFEPRTMVEVTYVALQNRHLLRPSAELNDLVVGVLGRAQRIHDMTVCSAVVLSTHLHLLLVPEDPENLAQFMCFVGTNLSKEIGRLHQWSGKLWSKRYQMVPVSWEEPAQVRRLEYLLSNSVKEFLVDRVAQWPGVHSAESLVEGKPLVGHWYDRTKERAARQQKGKTVDPDPKDFATEEQLVLSPIPCWEHLPPAAVRQRVAEIVARIDEAGAQERKRKGRVSLGVKKILRVRPHKRPRRVEKSPKPRFHAATKRVLKQLRDAHAEVVAAFREASARLLAGEIDVGFPEGTFPPGLPFVPFASGARGHPA